MKAIYITTLTGFLIFASLAVFFFMKDKPYHVVQKVQGPVIGKLEELEQHSKGRANSVFHVFLQDTVANKTRDIVVSPLTYFQAEKGKNLTFLMTPSELEPQKDVYCSWFVIFTCFTLAWLLIWLPWSFDSKKKLNK